MSDKKIIYEDDFIKISNMGDDGDFDIYFTTITNNTKEMILGKITKMAFAAMVKDAEPGCFEDIDQFYKD